MIKISTILTLIFVILKLTNNIDWDWINVLSPSIIAIILLIICHIIIGEL